MQTRPTIDDKQPVHLFFDRPMVERQGADEVIQQLAFFTANADNARKYANTMSFCFDGWDDDPRPISEIPATRQFIRMLVNRWPYWLHFACKTDYTIPVILQAMTGGTRVNKPDGVTYSEIESTEVREVLGLLFDGMNNLYARLGLTKDENDRMTRDIGECIQASKGPQ